MTVTVTTADALGDVPGAPTIATAIAEESAAEPVRLTREEAELVNGEATAAARVLPEPVARQAARLVALTAQADASTVVPDELVEVLEHVVSSSLQGGRARRLYRAEGEKLLNRILSRTPGGRERAAALDEVNQALGALSGRRLDGVRVATRIPGQHTVRIATDGVVITLGLGAGGVTVESVAT